MNGESASARGSGTGVGVVATAAVVRPSLRRRRGAGRWRRRCDLAQAPGHARWFRARGPPRCPRARPWSRGGVPTKKKLCQCAGPAAGGLGVVHGAAGQQATHAEAHDAGAAPAPASLQQLPSSAASSRPFWEMAPGVVVQRKRVVPGEGGPGGHCRSFTCSTCSSTVARHRHRQAACRAAVGSVKVTPPWRKAMHAQRVVARSGGRRARC